MRMHIKLVMPCAWCLSDMCVKIQSSNLQEVQHHSSTGSSSVRIQGAEVLVVHVICHFYECIVLTSVVSTDPFNKPSFPVHKLYSHSTNHTHLPHSNHFPTL